MLEANFVLLIQITNFRTDHFFQESTSFKNYTAKLTVFSLGSKKLSKNTGGKNIPKTVHREAKQVVLVYVG